MQGPRWLDENEQAAWRLYLSSFQRLTRVLGRELQQSTGLSNADYMVLVNLSEAPGGRLRPFALGVATEWEKSRLSHHLTRMERRGLVERQVCDSDSRGAFVALTETGRRAIAEAAPLHVEQVRRWFFDALSPAEVGAIASSSRAVLAGLDRAEGAGCDRLGDVDGTGLDGDPQIESAEACAEDARAAPA